MKIQVFFAEVIRQSNKTVPEVFFHTRKCFQNSFIQQHLCIFLNYHWLNYSIYYQIKSCRSFFVSRVNFSTYIISPLQDIQREKCTNKGCHIYTSILHSVNTKSVAQATSQNADSLTKPPNLLNRKLFKMKPSSLCFDTLHWPQKFDTQDPAPEAKLMGGPHCSPFESALFFAQGCSY